MSVKKKKVHQIPLFLKIKLKPKKDIRRLFTQIRKSPSPDIYKKLKSLKNIKILLPKKINVWHKKQKINFENKLKYFIGKGNNQKLLLKIMQKRKWFERISFKTSEGNKIFCLLYI